MNASSAEVARRLEKAGISLPAPEVAALDQFLELLARWNRVYNLTGIRNRRELIERHLVESLALRPLLRGDRIADVGTGAGLAPEALRALDALHGLGAPEEQRRRALDGLLRDGLAAAGPSGVSLPG